MHFNSKLGVWNFYNVAGVEKAVAIKLATFANLLPVGCIRNIWFICAGMPGPEEHKGSEKQN